MKHSKGFLEEILKDEPCGGNCIASMLLQTHPMQDYMLMQFKMIEKFKYVWSEDARHDIGWEEATRRYTDLYGQRYRELWDEGERHCTAMFWALRKGK